MVGSAARYFLASRALLAPASYSRRSVFAWASVNLRGAGCGIGPGADRALERSGDALQPALEELVPLREPLHLPGEVAQDLLQW